MTTDATNPNDRDYSNGNPLTAEPSTPTAALADGGLAETVRLLEETKATMRSALDLLDKQRRECEEARLVPLNGRNITIKEGPIAKTLRQQIANIDAALARLKGE